MARTGPLKQILRELKVEELRYLRREFCPRVSEYSGDKKDFIDKLRDSMKRSIEDGSLSYAEIFSMMRSRIEDNGPKQNTTRKRQEMKKI